MELKKTSARKQNHKKSDLVPIIISEMRSRLESAIKNVEAEKQEAKDNSEALGAELRRKANEKFSAIEQKVKEVVDPLGLPITSNAQEFYYGHYMYRNDPKGTVLLVAPRLGPEDELSGDVMKKLGLGDDLSSFNQTQELFRALSERETSLKNKLSELDEKNIHIQAYIKRKELEETESGRELLSRVNDFADLYEKLGIDQSLLSQG